MKVYSNYPEPTISKNLAALLVQLLEFEGKDVWLISPWLKDVRLAIAQLGDFSSLLGGQREEIDFSDLLIRIAEQHTLHVVTKPPGELIYFKEIKRLESKFDLRKRLLAETEDELKGYSIVDEVIDELNADIERLVGGITVHADTIRIGRMLQAKGAQLYYLDKLHAKLLCTPIGVLIGSANFTNGGLSYNDELMLEITGKDECELLQQAAQQIIKRAVNAKNYNINQALKKADYPIDKYLSFANSNYMGYYPKLQEFLLRINIF